MVGGIVHKNAEDIKLVYKEKPLDVDNRTLADVGLTAQSTKAQSPALIGLCFKEGGNYPNLFFRRLSKKRKVTCPRFKDIFLMLKIKNYFKCQ